MFETDTGCEVNIFQVEFDKGYFRYTYDNPIIYLYEVMINVPNSASGHYKNLATSTRMNTQDSHNGHGVMFMVDDIKITVKEVFVPILKHLITHTINKCEINNFTKLILQMS